MLHHFVYSYAIGAGGFSASHGEQSTVQYTNTLKGGGGGAVGSSIQGGGQNGTIVLNVVQADNPDGSRVFNVTQSGFNRGKSFLCAAYGQTGDVVCNSQKPPDTPLLILLRIAGAGFYSPSHAGAKKHWRIDSPGSNLSETADFTILKAAGPLVTIAMKRRGEQLQPPMRSTIDGTIVYDTAEKMPQSIDTTFVLTPQGGGGHSSSIEIAQQR